MSDFTSKLIAFATAHPTRDNGSTWNGACGAFVYQFVSKTFGWAKAPTTVGPTAADVRKASTIESTDPAKAPAGAFHFWNDGGSGHVAIDLAGGGTHLGMATSVTTGSSYGAGGYIRIMSVAAYNAARPALKYAGWSTDYGKGIANIPAEPTPAPTPVPTPAKLTAQQLAVSMKAGTWGNEPQRSQKLHALGYTDAEIAAGQAIVNAQTPKPALKVGGKAKFTGTQDYKGTKLASFTKGKTYFIREIVGDRVVIDTDMTGAVTAAVHAADLNPA